MILESLFLYFATFILAGCSILYELIIAQTISVLAANTVSRYSLTIGVYLGSMGIGTLLYHKIFKNENLWGCLFAVEIILSVLGSMSAFIIYNSHMLSSYLYDFYKNAVMVFFLSSFSTAAAVGFCTGLELPLLITIGNRLKGEKKITNRILGVDYLGSLAGAILFPLLLLPRLELLTISFITALLNLFTALLILLTRLRRNRGFAVKLGINSMLLLLLIAGLANISRFHQYFLKKYYYYDRFKTLSELFSPAMALPNVERFSSPYQKIDIVNYPSYDDPYSPLLTRAYSKKYIEEPDYPRNYYLYLNGEYQISTEYEEIYHEYFVHVPIILNKKIPERVLVAGGGDGLADRELLKYPGIKTITHVELDREMIKNAMTHPILRYINKGALENPRVEIKIRDAYQYIKNTDERFDAIFIDFPYPVDYNLSKLFSSEFYHFVKKCLKKGGFAVIDAPGSDNFIYDHKSRIMKLEKNSDWFIYYNTLRAAGFGTILPFVSNLELDNEDVYKIFLNASSSNPDIDINKIESNKMEHVLDLQKGFIFVKNDQGSIDIKYKKPDVKLYVLNEKRFYLAFSLFNAFKRELDIKKVNSIMKPSFPSLPFWDIRLP